MGNQKEFVIEMLKFIKGGQAVAASYLGISLPVFKDRLYENKDTRFFTCDELLALLKPSSKSDSWNGEKWVLDTNKQHNYYVNMVTSQKSQLISETNEKISYLQDALDAEMTTE